MSLDRPVGLVAWAKWVLVGPRHHLWMYDGDSLTRLLRDAGFKDVTVVPPGTTNIPDPGHLDLQQRAAESVYVEAVRARPKGRAKPASTTSQGDTCPDVR